MKIEIAMAGLAIGVVALATFGSSRPEAGPEVAGPGDSELVVAAGCFWCVEAIFEELRGVSKVVSGYTGGKVPNPTYEQVCAGITGHAEAVKVYYNPAEISAEDLLRIFLTTHDPTTLNRQGPDTGTQYRSAIFLSTEEERARAEKVIKEISEAKIWSAPIVTTIEPLREFYLAEEYHQNYYDAFDKGSELQKMRMNAGYCRAVIEPKVAKFRKMYRDKLKK